ncbi:MAG: hypothetical protein LBR65_06020 [Culturomica sp.]|nr:hypothetical protein [Culturomica sp.]
MKKIFFSLLVMLGCIGSSVAQEKSTYITGFDTQLSLYGGSGLKPAELGFDFGYNFTDWFYGAVRFEESIALFEIDGVRSYALNEVMGGVAGFNLLKSGVGVLTLKVSAGGTSRKRSDWKYAFYSGGVYFNIGKTAWRPVLGCGVRYYDSRSRGVDNYLRFYCSFGFRLN